MEKYNKNVLIVAATLVIMTLILTVNNSPKNTLNEDTIAVKGFGEVSVVPDSIGLYFNVEGTGIDAKSAKDENSKNSNQLIDSLMGEGFLRSEIQTLNYNIYEDFDWTENGRVSKGYKATQSIVVKIPSNESEKIGNIIDAGVDSNTTLSYINFELSRELENEYRALAVELAAKDAKTQAEALARGTNKKLGKLISITNQESSYPQWKMYDFAVDEVSTSGMDFARESISIEPAERKISVGVSAIYKLK